MNSNAEEFGRSLNRWADKVTKGVAAMQGTFTFLEIFPDAFVKERTDFASLQDMFDGCESMPDDNGKVHAFLATPEWDAYVAANTDFENWAQMRDEAIAELARRKVDEQ